MATNKTILDNSGNFSQLPWKQHTQIQNIVDNKDGPGEQDQEDLKNPLTLTDVFPLALVYTLPPPTYLHTSAILPHSLPFLVAIELQIFA